jgi:hypothetical protein
MSRCVACGDFSPAGWSYCMKCHAWNDLFVSIEHAAVGIDERRLQRALRFLRPRRPRVRDLERGVAQLARRIADLEGRIEAIA